MRLSELELLESLADCLLVSQLKLGYHKFSENSCTTFGFWFSYRPVIAGERFAENRVFNNVLCCFRHATTVRQVSPRHGRRATRKAEHDTRLVSTTKVQHELVEVFIKTFCPCYYD